MSLASFLKPPDFELAAAYPEVGRLRQAAAARDWQAVWDFVGGLPPGVDRAFVTSALGQVPGIESALRELVAAVPEDAFALTLLAAREVQMGWDARSGAKAEHVSAKQFGVFHEHLRTAERLLIKATALDPYQDAAWAERLNTARGLQLGQNEARRRYDQLAKHHPNNLTGQARLLQQLCPKWSGDWERAHGFARECMLASPEGSLNAGLVAEAHLEHWSDLGKPGPRAEYLRQPHIHQELVTAAEHSVLHPRFTPAYGWVTIQGVFAVMFSYTGDRARAAAHFRALDGLASSYPWELLGQPAAVYVSMRAAALARG